MRINKLNFRQNRFSYVLISQRCFKVLKVISPLSHAEGQRVVITQCMNVIDNHRQSPPFRNHRNRFHRSSCPILRWSVDRRVLSGFLWDKMWEYNRFLLCRIAWKLRGVLFALPRRLLQRWIWRPVSRILRTPNAQILFKHIITRYDTQLHAGLKPRISYEQNLLSASTSSMSSSRIFLLNGCPMSRKMSATMSVGMLPDRSRSNASKAFLRTEQINKNLKKIIFKSTILMAVLLSTIIILHDKQNSYA